ncbi:SLC13 family permease [Thermodesulfobacteriota bacterium]
MAEKKRPGAGVVIASLSIAAGIVLLIFPLSSLSHEEARAAALTIVVISFWATSVIPEHLTALLFFLFAMLFAIAPPQVVFSGFQSTALWMIFSGLIISLAMTGTGFGNRIAAGFIRHLVGSYLRLIGGIVTIGSLLSFFMPAGISRVLLLMPITLAIADHCAFHKSSNGRKGVVMATVFGAIIPGFGILPASVPNMIMAGLAGVLEGLSIHAHLNRYKHIQLCSGNMISLTHQVWLKRKRPRSLVGCPGQSKCLDRHIPA